jgi:predicted kinase
MSYEVMFQFCQTQLSLGLTVVVDCPLARPELYRRAAALAEQVRCGPVGVFSVCVRAGDTS